MHARITLALGTAGIFLALSAPDAALAQDQGVVMQAAVQHPLARTWILNVEKSDNAQEKMQQAQRRRSGPGDAGGARRGATAERSRRRRGGAGARGSRPAPEAMATNRVAQQRIMRPARRISIVLSDSTAAIGADDLVPWLFPTDKSKRDHQDGVELTGELDGNKLQVETNTEGGLRIRETYELKDDNTVLEVSVTIENNISDLRVRFKRVYDAEDAAGGDL